MSGLPAIFSISNFRVPPGTYTIMDAGTRSYMNDLGNLGPGGPVVGSIGNFATNDIWNVMPSEIHNLTIQSFSTGYFMGVNGSNVVMSATIHPWALIPNTSWPYSFNVQDVNSSLCARLPDGANADQVTLVSYNETDQNQAWFFLAKEPMASYGSG